MAPISWREAVRFRATAARESSLVRPRLRSPFRYAREDPPTRVEKPCTSQGNCVRCLARRMVRLDLIGARVGTRLCYLYEHPSVGCAVKAKVKRSEEHTS